MVVAEVVAIVIVMLVIAAVVEDYTNRLTPEGAQGGADAGQGVLEVILPLLLRPEGLLDRSHLLSRQLQDHGYNRI